MNEWKGWFFFFFCIIWVILSSYNLNVFQRKATNLKVITKKGLYAVSDTNQLSNIEMKYHHKGLVVYLWFKNSSQCIATQSGVSHLFIYLWNIKRGTKKCWVWVCVRMQIYIFCLFENIWFSIHEFFPPMTYLYQPNYEIIVESQLMFWPLNDQ